MDIISRIRKANLHWDTLPKGGYFYGPYIGNGNIGAVVSLDENGKLLIETSRVDFCDHRNDTLPILFRTCRLKSGYFSLSMDGENLDGSMALDIYDATISGTLKTNTSEAKVRIFNCDDRGVFVIELEKVNGECNFDLVYNPLPCESPRIDHKPCEGYVPYPPATFENDDGISCCVQSLPEDEIYQNVGMGEAEFVTAFTKEEDDSFVRFYVTLVYTYPGKGARKLAKDTLCLATKEGAGKLCDTHLSFWHDF